MEIPLRRALTVARRRTFTTAASGMRVRLTRGDLSVADATALITSANDSLVGNADPMYWRFISRQNADGAIRRRAGHQLEEACLAFAPLDERQLRVRRDITRWTTGVKRGASAVVRCPAGSAVSTAASGDLLSKHVIHAVAPDSEFGYEGQYTGGWRDTEMSRVEGRGASEHDIPQFSPPDALLLSAYVAAFAEAERLGASDVACCVLGTGVKGWKPAISAAMGLEAIARCLRRPTTTTAAASAPAAAASHTAEGAAAAAPRLSEVSFVVGGMATMAQPAWRAWVRTASALLGPPAGVDASSLREAERHATSLEWHLPWRADAETAAPLGAATAVSAAGARTSSDDTHEEAVVDGLQSCVLPLESLPEMAELLRNRERGYSGMEQALTPEQELRAASRRVMGPGGSGY